MSNFIDSNGIVYRTDAGANLFIGKKVVNPNKDSELTVRENTEQFINREDVKPLSFVTGHVPNFEHGYGDNKVIVNTGKEAK